MTRLPRHYAAARTSYAGELVNAFKDFLASFGQVRLWSTLAFNDILARYRGSILGPFWITLSSAVFTVGIGLTYAKILKVPSETYVPWIGTGVIIWNLISAAILEGGDAFTSSAPIIRQTNIPLPVFLWRVMLRTIIVLAHQVVIVVAMAIYYNYWARINVPVAAAGLLLVLVNLAWIAFAVGIVAARFRDLQQVNTSVLQLAFFLSPVIWIPSGEASDLLKLNPIFHMLDVTRNPLIGLPADLGSFAYLLTMAIVGWVCAFMLFATTRRRIVHYL